MAAIHYFSGGVFLTVSEGNYYDEWASRLFARSCLGFAASSKSLSMFSRPDCLRSVWEHHLVLPPCKGNVLTARIGLRNCSGYHSIYVRCMTAAYRQVPRISAVREHMRPTSRPNIFMDDFPSESVSGPSPFQRTCSTRHSLVDSPLCVCRELCRTTDRSPSP